MLNRDTVRQLELPRRIDGALFSLSYSVRPDPLGAVAATWKYLKPGKSLFIMDGQLARGVFGRLSRPTGDLARAKKQSWGDAIREPWEDSHEFDSNAEMEELNLGTYDVGKATEEPNRTAR